MRLKQETIILYRQVITLTKASLAARYRKTFAGFIWVNLDPLINYGVQNLIFRHIIGHVHAYGLFLATGFLPWIFIMNSLRMCTPIYEAKKDFLKTYKIPPVLLLLAQLMDNFINFIFTSLLILPILYFWHNISLITLLFLPISIVLLAVGVFALSWLLATAQVFYKDTKFIIANIINMAYWLTPVFYPVRYWGEYKWVLYFNPFYHYTNLFRANIYDFQLKLYLENAINVIILNIILLCIAFVVWRKSKNGFYLNL